MASGDRRREWPIRDRIQEAETESLPANAAESRAFRALIRNWLERPDWLAGAGGFEPPNGGIKIQMIWQRFQCAFRKTHEIQAYIDQ